MIGNETAAFEAGDFSRAAGTLFLTRLAGDGFFFMSLFNRTIEAAMMQPYEISPPPQTA